MNGEQKKTKKRIALPHPLVAIFAVMLLAAALTYLVPLGRYELRDVAFPAENQQRTSAAVDPDSFRCVMDENNERVVHPAPFFTQRENNEQGIMNFLFSGLENKRIADTASLIAYLLIIGGSFGVLQRTGAMDQIILIITRKTDGISALLPPILFVLFSAMGVLFGASEAALPLAMLLVPLLICMGFDAITGVLCTFAAMQIGMACSWASPATLAAAQELAGVPLFSGAPLRIVLWLAFTAGGAAYTTVYALRVQEDPRFSASQASDARCRGRLETVQRRREPLSLGCQLILLTVLASLIWLIWGMLTKGYGLSEIASLFFVMALAAGLLGAGLHQNGMQFADIPRAFQAGASEMIGAVLAVGMAQGIALLMGGTLATSASTLNTLLHWTHRTMSQLPAAAAAWLMYVFQFLLHFISPSDAGQAALTMPVMAPLADTLGISRQVSVLALQLGSSLSNLIVPTSGCLLGVLSLARLEWGDWLRSQWRMLLVLFVLASAAPAISALLRYF